MAVLQHLTTSLVRLLDAAMALLDALVGVVSLLAVAVGFRPCHRADRRISAAALSAIEAARASARAPYGDGVPSSWSLTWHEALLRGVDEDECISELRKVLALDGELSIDELTEGVRRMLVRLHPWLPGAGSAYWSEADCRQIALSLTAGRDASAGGSASRRWQPEATLDMKLDLRERLPTHPPRWLEWTQLGMYHLAHLATNAVGLRSRTLVTPSANLHWYDSGERARGGAVESEQRLCVAAVHDLAPITTAAMS
jgi:hypothetical protein